MLILVIWPHLISEEVWQCVEGGRGHVCLGTAFWGCHGTVTSHMMITTDPPAAPIGDSGSALDALDGYHMIL